MGGGIKRLKLLISPGDKKIYCPGETVQGICEVILVDEHQNNVPGVVVISCKGKVKTRFIDNGSRRPFSESRDLLGMKIVYKPNIQGTESRTGSCFQLPFHFRLPENDLYTSVEYSSGYIRYWIEAESVVAGFVFESKLAKLPFKTLQIIDTNPFQFPVRASDTKTVGFWFWNAGKLSIEASTDRAAYCPSEIVAITALFRNKSNKMAKPYAMLRERRKFEAQGNKTTSIHEYKLEPVARDDGFENVIIEGGFTTWNGKHFRIPGATPSLDCAIIRVKYEIEVGLDIPWASDLKVFLPIVIGTIPFRGEPMSAPTIAKEQYQSVGNGAGSSRSQRVEPVAPHLMAPPATYNQANTRPPSYFNTILQNQQSILDENDD